MSDIRSELYSAPSKHPLISVIMANYCGGVHLEQAAMSVLRQSEVSLELIISDDASSDESVKVAHSLALSDPRVRVITSDINCGPARARNRALDVARGRWIAVVDSDDLLHPRRFERLLAAARQFDADIVADDLLHFDETKKCKISYLLHGKWFSKPFTISVEEFLGGGDQRSPPFGYLKPIIKSERLRTLRYNEHLKIGEDYELILHLLFQGANYVVVPEPLYLYRRHSKSISHRLSEVAIQGMILSQVEISNRYGPFTGNVAEAFEAQMAALLRALAFQRLVSALKDKRMTDAVWLLIRRPQLLAQLAGILLRRWAALVNCQCLDSLNPKKTAVTVFFSDGRSGLSDLERAQNLAERYSSKLVIETVPVWRGPVDYWAEPFDQQKERWKRLASLDTGDVVALLYNGEAGKFALGFIPPLGNARRVDITEKWQD